MWVGGWGQGENELGHQTVLWAEISQMQPDEIVQSTSEKLLDVLNKEPMYYNWIQKNDFTLDTKRKLTEIKLRQFNK